MDDQYGRENSRAPELQNLVDLAIREIEDDDVQRYTVVRIGDESVVDLLASVCGITFDEAIQSVQQLELDGVKIPTVSKQLLIRTKNTIRPSDKMDINCLLRIIEEENRERSKKQVPQPSESGGK